METKIKPEKLKLFFEAVQALLTCCAILAAGWWFVFQAEGDSKAKCSHKLSMVKVSNGGTNFWWGCLEVKIENVGQTPLDLTEGILKVSQIQPLPDRWDLTPDKETRLPWPQLVYRDVPFVNPVLPGEVDYRNFEFTMPTNVETFRVYSYVSLGKNRKMGWSKVSIYTIKDGDVIQTETPED